MMFRTNIFITVLLFAAAVIAAQAPKFKDYPAGKPYDGANAKLILSKDDRTYRTRLREASKDKRNFGGEYILGQIGCGGGCRLTFAINARTGKVAWLPFSLCCWEPADAEPTDARLGSRLIVLRGLRGEGKDEYKNDKGSDVHFYRIANGEFRYIKTIKQR
jgi:hypothetical protein